MSTARPSLKSKRRKCDSPYYGKGKGKNPNSIANLWIRQPGDRKAVPPDALQKVRTLAAQGRTLTTIAEQACRLGSSTFARLRREHPEYQEAIELGRADAENEMYDELRAIAKGGKGNPIPLMFILKARHSWAETGPAQESRTHVTINLPGPMRSLEDWTKAITVEQEQPLLPDHADGND